MGIRKHLLLWVFIFNIGAVICQTRDTKSHIDNDDSLHYYRLGMAMAEKDFKPLFTGALGFTGGFLLGPVGWGGAYGLMRWLGNKGITVPEPKKKMTAEERMAFKKGYIDCIKLMRRKNINSYGMFGCTILVMVIISSFEDGVSGAGA